MKNLFLLIFVFISMSSFAQVKFASYDNTYIDKTYDIEISLKEDGGFKLYIRALSLDDIHEVGGILVSDNKYQKFIDALNEASLKYDEWEKTAKENNVKELRKEMPIKCKVEGFFKYGGEWHYQSIVIADFAFMVTEMKGEVKHLLIVGTGKMQSSTNQFMDVDGVALVFTSSAEIRDFVNIISMNRIQEFRNKPKVEELFK